MKRRTMFQALLFVSIVVITMPTLAVEPGDPSPETRSPTEAREMALGLPGWETAGEPVAKGELVLSSPAGLAGSFSPTGLLLSEGFEDDEYPPPGWSVVNTHPTNNWSRTNYPGYAHSGEWATWVLYDTPIASDEWLLTPVFDLTGIAEVILRFWARSDTAYCPPGSGATMKLWVTDASDTLLATVWDMCDDENWPTFEYRKVEVDLSAYTGQQIRLAWQYVGIDGETFALDDVNLFGSAGGDPIILMEPGYQRKLGDPCDAIQYTVTMRNLTNQDDTFSIDYTPAGPASGPSSTGLVGNNQEYDIVFDVTIPCGAVCPACEPVEVKVTAGATPAISETVTVEACAADPWQERSVTGASAAQWVASTCTDEVGPAGTCYYVGGVGTTGVVTNAARRYDISSGKWFSIRSVPTPVFGATLGYIDGKLYLAGGFTSLAGDWSGTYELQIYNVATNTWSAGPDMPAWEWATGAGGSNGAVLDGRLHVVGGGGCGRSDCPSNQHAAYDPGSNTWTQLAPAPYASFFFGATSGGGRLFMGGDYFGGNDFYAYDPDSGSWEDLANLPRGAGKKDPVMAYVPDCGGVFVYGGDHGNWSSVEESVWFWHPIAENWVEYPSTLNEPISAAGGGYANGRLWIFGGSRGAGAISPPPHESLDYCCPVAPLVGGMHGFVTDADTGMPLENASVELASVIDPDLYDQTWTDATGYYALGPLLVGEYELVASAYGYYSSDPESVLVEEDVTKQVHLALDAATPELSHGAVGVSLDPICTGTFTITLDNPGSGELHFHVSELPADSIVPMGDLGEALAGSSRVDPQVYADLEASPDGTAKFIVSMAEQADLTEAFAIKDRSARGWYVYNALRATAQQSQVGLRAELDRAGVWFETRTIVNAMVVKGDLETLNRIAARPEVAFIGANALLSGPDPVGGEDGLQSIDTVVWNIQKVRADEVWSTTEGEGIVVANIDTGVQWNHPALVDQYRGGAGNHDYHWWDASGEGSDEPTDTYGHGTHTMGTMVGDDGNANQIGMAPGAEWIACRAGSGREMASDALLECADFLLAPWDLNGTNADPDVRPDVVNNSWGGGQAQWWYNQAVYAWRAAGIFPVFSAGNSGPSCGTAEDPADMANAMAVGATDANDSNDPGTQAYFSGRGPTRITNRTHPDVSAPGADIYSSLPGGEYGKSDGTSMAAPHVAGEVALIWAAEPDLRGNVQLTEWVVERTAEDLPVTQGYFCGDDTGSNVPNNQYGWGRIDAFEAVSLAQSANWDVGWLEVEPVGGMVPPAASADIALHFDSAGLDSGRCYNAHLKMEYNDPFAIETFMPVALCVASCMGPDDITITGPLWNFPDSDGVYSFVLEPMTATLPISIEWDNGTTDTVAIYGWSSAGMYTIVVSATNCGGRGFISDYLRVEVVEPTEAIYLPLVYKMHLPLEP